MMKLYIKKLVPILLIERYRLLKQFIRQRKNVNQTTEEVFTEIYKHNQWGGLQKGFYSGPGSTNKQIVSDYITMISEKASSENFLGKSFVDLGCGDFLVGKQLIPLCSSYLGVDIVKSLIQHNQKKHGNEVTSFKHLDIVEDELPVGDVCFIRQVFQHLSNKQIVEIIPKLKIYKWIFITEHYPTNNNYIKPNLDKICGSDIRLHKNSGVYLTKPPFELPIEEVENVLIVPGVGMCEGIDPGVISTYLYKPES